MSGRGIPATSLRRSRPWRVAAGIVILLGLIGWIPATARDGLPQTVHRDRGQIPTDPARDRDLPYHFGPTLICSDCHVSHASESSGSTPAADGGSPASGRGGPYGKLLRDDVTDLCLSCHDNHAGVPDVMGGDVNGLHERSGGFFTGVGMENPRGHDLGRELPRMDTGDGCMRCHFAGVEERKVTCVDCHDPHGNGNPRGLQWASFPEGTPPIGLFNPSGITGPAKYERGNVAYGTTNTSALREVSNICLDCHHIFSGDAFTDPDGNGIHSLHPAYDSERFDPNRIAQGGNEGTTNPAHWMLGVGSGFDGTRRVPFVTAGATDFASAAAVNPETNGVFCLSCHKAHGSEYAFGLAWDIDRGVGQKGCDQCHAPQPLP